MVKIIFKNNVSFEYEFVHMYSVYRDFNNVQYQSNEILLNEIR